jgi:hypothetical protein
MLSLFVLSSFDGLVEAFNIAYNSNLPEFGPKRFVIFDILYLINKKISLKHRIIFGPVCYFLEHFILWVCYFSWICSWV